MKTFLLRTALAAALVQTLAAAPAAMAADFRNEVAIEWSPAAFSNDDRRARDLSYMREFGNGWALGGAVGYGNVDRGKSDDGVLLLLRARWRAPALGGLGWLRPQVGLEYGGTSNVFQTSDIAALSAGVHMAASEELGVTVDYWAGNSHYEAGATNIKRSASGVRLGLAFRY